MIQLVLAHLQDRPMPVALNVALIAFAGALLLTLASLSSHINTRFARDMANIDMVVSAKGSPLQVILSSLFHVDIPTGNIPLKAAQRVERDPLIAQAIPIAIGDRFRGVRVVGATPDYLSLYGAEAAQGVLDIQGQSAVVGASAAKTLGLSRGQTFAISHGLANGGATHAANPLTVTAILEPTQSVLDRLIVTSLEAIWEAHGIEVHANDDDDHASDQDDHKGGEQEITALLVRYASPLAAVRLPQQIQQQTQMTAAVPAYETARLLSMFGASRDAGRIIASTFALLGGFAIFVSLWSALDGREADIALYRLMGIPPRDIFSLLILEGLLTAVLGAIGAWLTARLCLWQLWTHISMLRDSGFAPLAPSTLDVLILVTIVAFGALAAVPAALKAARMSLERALA